MRSKIVTAAAERPVIASISEKSRFTIGGSLCAVLMGVSAFLPVTMGAGAKTVFQEIEADVWGLCGIILFGVGAIIGRERTYTVYRELPNATNAGSESS
jgi:hypothetical protein